MSLPPHLYGLPPPVVRMKARRELEEQKREMLDSLARLDEAVAFVKRMSGETPVAAAMQ